MTIQSNASGSENPSPQSTPRNALSTSPGEVKPTISPAERWLKIREKAYVRVQKRGFVGGNPFADWLEAEKEVDAAYDTDPRGVFSLGNPAEITRQIKAVLADFGSSHLSVDALLEQHRERMERFDAFNRTLMDSTSELVHKQTALVRDSLNQAVDTLQSVTQGSVDTDGMVKQAELSIKAIDNAVSHLKTLTEAVTEVASGSDKDTSSES